MVFFFRKISRLPRKILFVRTDRIGDLVLSLPVFEAFKQLGESTLTVLCSIQAAVLLEKNSFVDHVLTLDENLEVQNLCNKINEKQFDCVLILVNHPNLKKTLPALRNIPIRIGPLSKPHMFFFYTHPVIQKRSHSLKNEAVYNLELLQIFSSYKNSQLRPKLVISDIEKTQWLKKFNLSEKKISKMILIHPGMGGSALNWNGFPELVGLLLSKGYLIGLTGRGKQEQRTNQALYQSVSTKFVNQIVDFTGKLDLRELAILIYFVKLFVGPSTGPTHLANALKTKVISFYPPILVQSPIRWAPYLMEGKVFFPEVNCGQKYKCRGEKCEHYYCMDSIEVKSVMDEVANVFSQFQRAVP